MRLLLASASARRADLLAAAGFDFDTLAVDIDERALAGESPEDYVRRLAGEKSARAAARLNATPTSRDVVVLGADTAVVIDGEILGKPRDDRDAEGMLRRLAGRQHDVLTGISLRRDGAERAQVETSSVSFAPLTAEEIEWYVASGEGRDKAGAYAIQGLASRFIHRIEGSYSNVVGLPISAVYELLRQFDDRKPAGRG